MQEEGEEAAALAGPKMRKTGITAVLAATAALVLMVPGSAAADADTACHGDGVVTTPATQSQVEGALLCLVNRYRQDNLLTLLKNDTRLSAASRQHSAQMKAAGYLAHDNPFPLFDTPRSRAFVNLYFGGVGENLGMDGGSPGVTGIGTAWSMFDQWRNSPTHNGNMLAPGFVASGLGAEPGCWCGGMAPAPFATGLMATQMYGIEAANTGETGISLNFGPIPRSVIKQATDVAKKCKRKKKKTKKSAAAAKKKKKCKKKR